MSSNELELGKNIKFSTKRRFGIITISRQESGNALTLKMLKDLKKCILHCQENPKIRGILLSGEGTSFTTGLDLRSFDASKTDVVKKIEDTARFITDLLYYGKPVISAINGKAMGDGVIYALASDYRLVVKEAYFQMPEIKFGIFPGTGCVVLMTKVLGISWTKKMLMFAEKISADKAVQIGLADEVVENSGELMKRAMDKAKFLFPKNQTVLNATKLCSNHLMDKPYMEAYELEKMGSAWYEYDNTEEYLSEFRKRLM